MVIYGIRNCNTVKNALIWLKSKGLDFDFHDYKSKGITEAKLKDWCSQVGWEALVNKKGTTWRQLEETEKQRVVNEKTAIELMLNKTSVIKRPLVEVNNKVMVLGFDEKEYSSKLK
ncbi:MAG: ArsC family reductase [Cytophagaceae bacterium]